VMGTRYNHQPAVFRFKQPMLILQAGKGHPSTAQCPLWIRLKKAVSEAAAEPTWFNHVLPFLPGAWLKACS
jgi:hypothetical protein